MDAVDLERVGEEYREHRQDIDHILHSENNWNGSTDHRLSGPVGVKGGGRVHMRLFTYIFNM